MTTDNTPVLTHPIIAAEAQTLRAIAAQPAWFTDDAQLVRVDHAIVAIERVAMQLLVPGITVAELPDDVAERCEAMSTTTLLDHALHVAVRGTSGGKAADLAAAAAYRTEILRRFEVAQAVPLPLENDVVSTSGDDNLLDQQRVAILADDAQGVASSAVGAHEVHAEVVHVRLDPTEVRELGTATDALVHGTGLPLGDDRPMTTFTVTLEEFKRGVAEFCRAAPACDAESLEHGFKAVGLMFLGTPDDRLTQAIARSYLDYASRRKLNRELEVDYG